VRPEQFGKLHQATCKTKEIMSNFKTMNVANLHDLSNLSVINPILLV